MNFWMGYVSGMAITLPKPMQYVSRSRRVIARCAGTVSSRSEEMDVSTRRFASSGSHGSTESSSRNLHSSTRIIAATSKDLPCSCSAPLMWQTYCCYFLMKSHRLPLFFWLFLYEEDNNLLH